MRSSSAKAVEFRRRIVSLINDLREGRLVYRDKALVASDPALRIPTALAERHDQYLPFDLAEGLQPVREVAAWAQSFGISPDPRRPTLPPR